MLGALESAGQVVDAPCVPRFRADPSYIAVSEASGGQILLLDRTEIANPAITRAHSGANHETILRVSGTLKAGSLEFMAPVDSGVQSLQFTIFAECLKSITVTAPSGAEAEGTKLSSGRIVILDAPEHGVWQVKLAGTGYFTAVAQAKGGVRFPPLRLEHPKPGVEQSLVAYLAGPVATAEFRVAARNGAILQVIPMTQVDDTEFRGVFTPPAEPFHIAVEGKDKQGLLSGGFTRLCSKPSNKKETPRAPGPEETGCARREKLPRWSLPQWASIDSPHKFVAAVMIDPSRRGYVPTVN